MRPDPGADPCAYTSPARVLLNGLGSDELLGGYGRHRTAFKAGGWQAVIDEVCPHSCHAFILYLRLHTASAGDRSHTYKKLGKGRPRHIVLGQGDKTPIPLALCGEFPRTAASPSQDGSTGGTGCRGETFTTLSSAEAGASRGEWKEEEGDAVWQPFSENGSRGKRQERGPIPR